jgi:hypothetical protein
MFSVHDIWLYSHRQVIAITRRDTPLILQSVISDDSQYLTRYLQNTRKLSYFPDRRGSTWLRCGTKHSRTPIIRLPIIRIAN